MGSIRMYTGDDGNTHIEEINPSDHPAWNELHDAKGIIFRAQQPGFFSDWHIAPRRQYIITLSGEAEIGLKDGTVHRLGGRRREPSRGPDRGWSHHSGGWGCSEGYGDGAVVRVNPLARL